MSTSVANVLNIRDNILKLGEVRDWMLKAGAYLREVGAVQDVQMQFHPGSLGTAGRATARYRHELGSVKLHVRQAPGETCVAQLVVFDTANVPLYSAVHETGLCELSVLNWIHLAIEEHLLPSRTIQ